MLDVLHRQLPEIKVHLELVPLPNGWITQYSDEPVEEPSTATDPSDVRLKEIEDEKDENMVVAALHHSTNAHRNSFTIKPSTSSSSSHVSTTRRCVKRYLNYWTGEVQNELPLTEANTGLLNISKDIALVKKLKEKSSRDNVATSSPHNSSDVKNPIE